jgi:hypothetical protein
MVCSPNVSATTAVRGSVCHAAFNAVNAKDPEIAKLLKNLKTDSIFFYVIGGLQILVWFLVGPIAHRRWHPEHHAKFHLLQIQEPRCALFLGG